MSTTLMRASREWATRPGDQRDLSLPGQLAKMKRSKNMSTENVIELKTLTFQPTANDNIDIIGPEGVKAIPTAWSMEQTARRLRIPYDYLKRIPSELACANINDRIQAEPDGAKANALLRHPNDTDNMLVAVNSLGYGRIWNADIVAWMIDHFGDGVTGRFRVPGEFGNLAAPITKQNTTLYSSDRDFFDFLADEKNRIELKNRRDGKTGSLARGFFIYNHENGDGSFGMDYFLFDYMCGNHIVWGVEEFSSIKLRHSSGAPLEWANKTLPLIEAYSDEASSLVTAAIEKARNTAVKDPLVWMPKKLDVSPKMADRIAAAHMQDEQRPIENVWDVVVGITALARDIPNQSDRVKMERLGGTLLKKAA